MPADDDFCAPGEGLGDEVEGRVFIDRGACAGLGAQSRVPRFFYPHVVDAVIGEIGIDGRSAHLDVIDRDQRPRGLRGDAQAAVGAGCEQGRDEGEEHDATKHDTNILRSGAERGGLNGGVHGVWVVRVRVNGCTGRG